MRMGMGTGQEKNKNHFLEYLSLWCILDPIPYIPCKCHGDVYVAIEKSSLVM
jgi:hypothetical protein